MEASGGPCHELRVATHPSRNPRVQGTTIYVDGTDFRVLLAQSGRPRNPTRVTSDFEDQTPNPYHRNDPGNWAGLPSSDVLLPSRHMFGEPVHEHSLFDGEPEGGPVALLACSCGVTGCAAVLADIEITDGIVTWTNIRCGSADPDWSGGYEFPALGSLRFDADQYTEALSNPDLLPADPRPARYP